MDILFWSVLISIFVFGLIAGSFLNCVIWRFHCGESAMSGRSYCPECRHKLAWFDLVPLFSFLCLGAKCRYCKKPISWQYPAVELAAALLFCFAALTFAPGIFLGQFSVIMLLELAGYWIVLAALAVIFVVDSRWYLIPDGAIAAGMLGAAILLAARLRENGLVFGRVDIGIAVDYLSAALIAGLFFLAIFLISKGEWIGFGDVKFAVLIGLALGFYPAMLALFLGNFFGAIMGLGLICAKKRKISSRIPFGPFLVSGMVVSMFFSSEITAWYWGF